MNTAEFVQLVAEHETELPCRDSSVNADDWFAGLGTPRCTRAQERCASCPLLKQCGEYAIDTGIPDGVWGGIHGMQRALIWADRGGKPTTFNEEIDAAIGPILQERRDFENFDANHPADVYEGSDAA